MNELSYRNWQAVQEEVLRRVNARMWKPGELIPNEVDLAAEFGCSRATVNRALQSLADSGLLDRKRKAGTRVALHPVRKATLEIPVIRREIEDRGHAYRYSLISSQMIVPPHGIVGRMQLRPEDKLLHLVCVHMADGKPYVFENRWINPRVVPDVSEENFVDQSPNEWLVEYIPFSSGDIRFSAMSASRLEADILACNEGEGLFVIDRSTWSGGEAITTVRLVFAPGYQMYTDI